MLELNIAESHLDLRLTGVTAVLARRRCVRLPRERIHRAFVLGRSFAMTASPRLPCPGWSTRRHRVGVFGIGDTAELWAAGSRGRSCSPSTCAASPTIGSSARSPTPSCKLPPSTGGCATA